jgi:hypothetical protein
MLFNGSSRKRRRRGDGQALVEFALVVPLFLTLVVAIFEFSFMFTTHVSASFASRDGSQIAAELGDAPCADHAILKRIQGDMQAPIDPNKIVTIDIFWADVNGNVKGGAINSWDFGGTSSCPLPDGSVISVPFHQTASSYPLNARCNIVSAAGCQAGHTTIDTIGVTVKYQYAWVTPLSNLIGLAGSAPLIVQTSYMRLEPVQ